MGIVRTVVGVAVLLMGRRLFWLFVAAVGFMYGFDLATRLVHGQPPWHITVIALLAGIAGAVLAYFLQRLAVAIAGFFVGGSAVVGLVTAFGWSAGTLTWLVFLAGGIVGALVVAAVFDWGLIILSSLLGATLIVGVLHPGPLFSVPLFAALVLVGVVTQAARMERQR